MKEELEIDEESRKRGDAVARTLAKQKREVDEGVGSLRKKVKEGQGQIALCLREIVTRGECLEGFMPETGTTTYYLETGIIDGGFEDLRGEERSAGNIFRGIEVRGIFDFDVPHLGDYYFSHDFAIPVKRRLVSSRDLGLLGILNFNPETLKKSEKGRIDFGVSELFGNMSLLGSGFEKSPPYLGRFMLAIGDEEVRAVVEKEKIGRQEIEDFFKLLKTPGEIERRVQEYDSGQRGDLARSLVQDVARLCLSRQGVLEIRGDVLKAKAYRETDDEGRYPYVEWDEFHKKDVEKYQGLRKGTMLVKSKIEKGLRQADEINLSVIGNIDGNDIGFPLGIAYVDWRQNIGGVVIPQTDSLLTEIDNYLASEHKRVEEEIKKRR